MTKKIAILSTSQLMSYDSLCLPHRQKLADDNGLSKGLYELLNNGYRVIIISTRYGASDEDKLWMDLIPIADIHFVGYKITKPWDANAPEYVISWRKVFAELGLVPPIDDSSWLNWRSAAYEQGIMIHTRIEFCTTAQSIRH